MLMQVCGVNCIAVGPMVTQCNDWQQAALVPSVVPFLKGSTNLPSLSSVSQWTGARLGTHTCRR